MQLYACLDKFTLYIICVESDAIITSGARSAERVYFYIPEKSQYERPAGRGHAL